MPRPSFAPACLTTTGVLTVLVLFQTVHVQGSCDCLCCSGGTCTPTVVGVAATRAACLATFGTACGACGSMSSPGVCAPVCDLPPLPRGGTRYNYTGAAQTYVVPAGVQTLNITAAGSEGGPAHNGFLPAKGGLSTAQLSVHPGQTLQVYVGGPGREANSFATAAGGFNGGGTGQSGTSGGGGSDVRTSPSLDSRVVVAGAGAGSAWSGGVGGAGGGDSGEAGKTGYDGKRGGGPGTQASGGACGEGGRDTCAGKAGKAGNCSTSSFFCSGGGGGWYGGGSSGDGSGSTAGGGSGYVPSGGRMTVAGHAGAGYIDIVPITGAPPSPPPGPSPTPPACTKALTNLCEEDRRKSAALCGLCAGIHQQQTREAGCTNTMIAKFCTNSTLWTAVNLAGPGSIPG